MAFNGLHLKFIRFFGPNKETAEFVFTPGLNILWGSSDTGKTFLVQAIDFMFGAGDPLRDIPQRVGYDRILMGVKTTHGKEYTIHRSINGGAFLRFEGLLRDLPVDTKDGVKLSAGHNAKNYNNLSHWLLQEIGLDKKEILYNKAGKTKSLGFRALAHLCIIKYPTITNEKSPLLSGNWTEAPREYAVFRLLLTGLDDSAITPDTAILPVEAKPNVERPLTRPDVLSQLISDYEDELATSLRNMEKRITDTSRERKSVYDEFAKLTARGDEIAELQQRFRLLDAQYTNDVKRLLAIEESGQLFVLRDPMTCPLCGAAPEGQHHEAACDGNVAAVPKPHPPRLPKSSCCKANY
jgi:hypothetical protein